LRVNNNSALLSIECPRENVLATPVFGIYEAELKHNGKVREIDIVKRAGQTGVMQECEVAQDHWCWGPHQEDLV
jgi:hypothetical protein